MIADRLRSIRQRRFAWLLWLGLLLPVAQAAASAHAFSHLRDAPASSFDAKHALHAAHCDLCLMGAAIAGGAPPGEPLVFAHPAVRHAVPQQACADVWQAPVAPAYLSRAPPIPSL